MIKRVSINNSWAPSPTLLCRCWAPRSRWVWNRSLQSYLCRSTRLLFRKWKGTSRLSSLSWSHHCTLWQVWWRRASHSNLTSLILRISTLKTLNLNLGNFLRLTWLTWSRRSLRLPRSQIAKFLILKSYWRLRTAIRWPIKSFQIWMAMLFLPRKCTSWWHSHLPSKRRFNLITLALWTCISGKTLWARKIKPDLNRDLCRRILRARKLKCRLLSSLISVITRHTRKGLMHAFQATSFCSRCQLQNHLLLMEMKLESRLLAIKWPRVWVAPFTRKLKNSLWRSDLLIRAMVHSMGCVDGPIYCISCFKTTTSR